MIAIAMYAHYTAKLMMPHRTGTTLRTSHNKINSSPLILNIQILYNKCNETNS